MLNKKSAIVSVIMNCHNGEKYLEDSVRSLINQTYENWELIFFENFSTDQSLEIIKKFKDKRIKIFKSQKFLNLYHARNEALKKISGKYICFLDTDDFWVNSKSYNYIENLHQFLLLTVVDLIIGKKNYSSNR